MSVQGSADWHREREDLVCLESDLADKYCKDRGENEKKGEKWPRVLRGGFTQYSSHRLRVHLPGYPVGGEKKQPLLVNLEKIGRRRRAWLWETRTKDHVLDVKLQ